MQSLSLFLCLLCSATLIAQDTSTLHHIAPATVTGYKNEPVEETSLNLVQLSIDSLSELGNFNLNDLMARTPGVSMLSTGVAIAKPVIRGAYGNRVLVLLSGLKFDNQQWQDEHGLGLNGFGLSRIELIKGPMSVLYGTEAMGGIINLIEEDKPTVGHKVADLTLKYNTNTAGGLLWAGVKENKGKSWYRIRLGAENHADYSDGSGKRVLNSRFDGYNLKASYGFEKKNWSSVNHYSGSFNRFGFIFSDIYTFIETDSRWSRSLKVNPDHLVLLNTLSSENKIKLRNGSTLSINAGLQSNSRRENEGGGAISLNMHLLTFQYLMRWETSLNSNHKIIVSHLGSVEHNTNYGARKIVPDASMQESNISLYLESHYRERWVWENGIGVGEKYLKTLFTPLLNGPDKEIKPFKKFAPYYNVFSGISYFKNKGLNIKFNVATGVRIPNLAELASDGLHEGVFTYEIGTPHLKNEQNIALNGVLNLTRKKWDFYLTPFFNQYFGYVFLAPTSENWFGFPVYRYRQQDATQYGGETALNLRPVKNSQLGLAFSSMQSKTADGNYTPFLPATKLYGNIQITLQHSPRKTLQCYAGTDHYFAQNRVFTAEIATPKYTLYNAGISGSWKTKNRSYEWSFAGNNLLNKTYYDHLSRFKYYGLNNIGRNIFVSLKINFQSPTP